MEAILPSETLANIYMDTHLHIYKIPHSLVSELRTNIIKKYYLSLASCSFCHLHKYCPTQPAFKHPWSPFFLDVRHHVLHPYKN
jgi:hypothetical protein